jgi:hypothetical protein
MCCKHNGLRLFSKRVVLCQATRHKAGIYKQACNCLYEGTTNIVYYKARLIVLKVLKL